MATRFVNVVRALFEEEGIFLLRYKKDKVGLGFAFETSPYMYADSRVENGFYTIIEKLPEDALMHAFLWADDDIEALLQLIQKGEGLAGRLFKERFEHYSKAAKEGGFDSIHPIRDFRLFLAFYIPTSDLENVKELKNEVTQTLESLKMEYKELTYEDFSELLDKVFYGRSGDGADSIEGLVPRNFELREEGKRIIIKDGREFSIISPYFLPNRFHIAMMARLLGTDRLEEVTSNLRRAFWIATVIRKKPTSEVKRLGTKGLAIERQAMGIGAKIAPHLKEAAKDFQMLKDRRDKGEKVVDLWLFAGTHPSEINKLATLFNNVAAEEGFGISSFKVFIEEAPGPVIEDFVYSLPFCFPWGEKVYGSWNRHFHLLGKDAVKFLPVMGDLKGNFADKNDFPPALTFVSPKGQVMFVDIFNSAAGYNFVTVASTGAGKSVLANDIINAYLAKKAVVRVIDVGGSYEKLAKLYNAPCLEIDPENPVCLNPFTNMKDTIVELEDADGTVHKVNISTLLVRDLIFIMLGIHPDDDMVSYKERLEMERDKGLIEKAINKVWQDKGTDATIEDVVDELPDHLQGALSRWIDNPWLRKFFVGKAEVNISDEPFYVIDLLKVKSVNDTSLFNTLMYLVLINIQKNVYLLPRNLKKVVIFDESWEFLQDKHIVPYIVRGYRIARKFNASFGVITQSVEDFLSEHSKPIIDNSNFIFMLELGEQSLAFLEKREGIAMNPYAVYLAKSVSKHPKNLWSEMLIYMRNQKLFGKARLFLDPISKYLYNTSAQEVALIKRLEPRLGTIGAVELLAKKNPVTLAILKGWLTDAQIREHGIDRIDDALAKGLISEWQYKELMKEWKEIINVEGALHVVA